MNTFSVDYGYNSIKQKHSVKIETLDESGMTIEAKYFYNHNLEKLKTTTTKYLKKKSHDQTRTDSEVV